MAHLIVFLLRMAISSGMCFRATHLEGPRSRQSAAPCWQFVRVIYACLYVCVCAYVRVCSRACACACACAVAVWLRARVLVFIICYGCLLEWNVLCILIKKTIVIYRNFAAVASSDGSLYIYSPAGRRVCAVLIINVVRATLTLCTRAHTHTYTRTNTDTCSLLNTSPLRLDTCSCTALVHARRARMHAGTHARITHSLPHACMDARKARTHGRTHAS